MSTSTSSGSARSGGGESQGPSAERSHQGGQGSGPGSSILVTEKGRTTIADTVVEKIAGMATREISGVHKLGAGAARALGALRERIPGQSAPLTQGVSVEVGERQTAIDLDIVVEYGLSLAEVTDAVRRNVISSVESMTGLEVTEVNIVVDDIHLPGDEDDEAHDSRVQ